jgi:uncharacterized protein
VVNLNIREKIRQAAESGDSFAQGHGAAEINLLLQNIFGQAKTLEPTATFNRLKAIAGSGGLDAHNNLGLCFQFGYGTEQNYLEAASCFRRAAESVSATAQFNLAGFYFEGKGLEKDLGKAIEWYTRSAEQRHELSLIKLGSLYQHGTGVAVDHGRAWVLYLIAYERGSLRAANHLGFMFKKGLGVKRNDSLAYQLYTESLSGARYPRDS